MDIKITDRMKTTTSCNLLEEKIKSEYNQDQISLPTGTRDKQYQQRTSQEVETETSEEPPWN